MSEKGVVRSFICGGFGGVCTVLVGHPFDTIKVRLQALPPGTYKGTWDCLTRTVRNEGALGLYKGMGAPLAGVSPIFAISFAGFAVGKKIMARPDREPSGLDIFMAGAFSGLFTTIIMAPGERIKCLLQIQQGAGDKKYAGPVDVIKKLYAEGGLRSIFRGSVATLARDIPASGCYYLTYDRVKKWMSNDAGESSMLVTILAGGLAGVSNWLVGMPADVLKSRLQTAPEGTYPNGLRDALRELLAKEGPLALYRGITPVMIRAFPANAACFVGYDFCSKFLNAISPQIEKPVQAVQVE